MKWFLPLLLPLAGCASMNGGQPLHVACLACSTLAASGACDTSRSTAKSLATASCPAGQELWVTNYAAFLERGAAPVIACHARRGGGDLP